MIDVARARALHQALGVIANACNQHRIVGAARQGKHARQDPHQVAIHGRDRFAESDRGDGGGGVRADAGQMAKLGGTRRHNAIVLGDDSACGFVQVARATVIAEPGPRLAHRGFLGSGQRCHRGKLMQELSEARRNGLHLRLLQHDFRHPNGVGILRAPPRKIALVLAVEGQQRALHVGDAHRFHRLRPR